MKFNFAQKVLTRTRRTLEKEQKLRIKCEGKYMPFRVTIPLDVPLRWKRKKMQRNNKKKCQLLLVLCLHSTRLSTNRWLFMSCSIYSQDGKWLTVQCGKQSPKGMLILMFTNVWYIHRVPLFSLWWIGPLKEAMCFGELSLMMLGTGNGTAWCLRAEIGDGWENGQSLCISAKWSC